MNVKNNPVQLDISELKRFVGEYGPRVVTLENNKLHYQRGTGIKYEIFPYSPNEFMVSGLDFFRIRFLSENDTIVAIEGLYDNGQTDKNLKSN